MRVESNPARVCWALAIAPGAKLNLESGGDLKEAAANLFAMLRELDKSTTESRFRRSPIPASVRPSTTGSGARPRPPPQPFKTG